MRANQVAGEVLVKLRPGLNRAGMKELAAAHGARLLEQVDTPAGFGGDLVRLAAGDAAVADLRRNPRVCYAEPNYWIYAQRPAESVIASAGFVPRVSSPTPATREVLMSAAGATALGLGGALAGSWLAGYPGGIGLALVGGLAGGWLGRRLANLEEWPEPAQERLLPANLERRQWALDNQGQEWGKNDADVDAPEAWAVTTGSRQPIVAVMDTGIDYRHPALAGNLWTNPEDGSHGYNAIDNNHDPMDGDNHGTHCGGIIAANGRDGVYGVSPQARLMGIKFMNERGTMADAIKGLAFADRHGARVVSHSWTTPHFSQAFKDALAASPALHILAAGNEGQNLDEGPIFPASYDLPNSLRVGASDRHNRLVSFSNYSRHHVDTVAPGQHIYSCLRDGAYGSLSGTSMAAPLVAGVANLVLARHPDISNEELKARLMRATRIPSMTWKVASGGVLNAARAVKD